MLLIFAIFFINSLSRLCSLCFWITQEQRKQWQLALTSDNLHILLLQVGPAPGGDRPGRRLHQHPGEAGGRAVRTRGRGHRGLCWQHGHRTPGGWGKLFYFYLLGDHEVKSDKIHSLVFGLFISGGDKRWSCVQCWARWECESGKVDVSPRESWLHHLGANVTIKGDSFDKTCCIHLPSHRGCCLWSRLRVDTSLVLVWLQWRSEENACRDLTTAAEIMQCQNCNIAP